MTQNALSRPVRRAPWRALHVLVAALTIAGCSDSPSETEAPAVRLQFWENPRPLLDPVDGSAFDPVVVVATLDADNQRTGGTATAVTLVLEDAPGAGRAVLTGATATAGPDGLARFSELRVTGLDVGEGYRLIATAPDLQGDTSSAFPVRQRTTAAFDFRVEPGDIRVGDRFDPVIEVVLLDSTGLPVPGGDRELHLSVLPGTGDPEGRVAGVFNPRAVDGIATFDDVTVTRPGTGYRLEVDLLGELSNPATPAVSQPFDVEPWAGTATTAEIVAPLSGQDPETYRYDQTNAVFTDPSSSATYASLVIDGQEDWRFSFEPGDDSLRSGTRYSVPSEGHMSVTGALACLQEAPAGWFAIDSVNLMGPLITELSVRFEQQCASGSDPLTGELHYALYDTASPPGPVFPVPAGLWEPEPGTTPGSGSYVHLTSQPGDPVGKGETLTFTPAQGEIYTELGGFYLYVQITGWRGEFGAMISIDGLEPGYYPDLGGMLAKPENPARGGLQWESDTGCARDRTGGWFAVDEITGAPGALQSLHLRFEQTCEGADGTLRGVVHIEPS